MITREQKEAFITQMVEWTGGPDLDHEPLTVEQFEEMAGGPITATDYWDVFGWPIN